jgi:uncharacterized membrane-anchored protein YitT (DUF2179 family)
MDKIFVDRIKMPYVWTNKVVSELVSVLGVLLGSFIFAYAINVLYVPFGFLSTGFNGVSMMLNYLLGWPIATCSYILNIVFVVIGFKLVDRRFAILSILGITAVSFFIEITKNMKIEVDNPIVAVVFGGLILGTGVGIALKSGGAIGGMNILGKIVNKYFSISIGTFDMCFNMILIIAAGFLFDINMAMYTIMARFVATKAMDTINEGINRTKTVIIISDNADCIANQLIQNVGRGVTFIESKGAYTGNSKNMIYCVVKLTQLSKVKVIVKQQDARAFMTIIDAKEVVGKGFK